MGYYIPPMPQPPLYGHEQVRARLLAAWRTRRLPQAMLFEGARGVGKQRLALWLAQAVLCQTPEETPAGGCGRCQACRLAVNLAHPDIHWVFPIEISRKSGDPDKQVEQVAEALAEELANRREHPFAQPVSGMATHSVAAVRLLARSLQLRPAMADRKVFIVGDAERLVPQRANPEAANALLKALEEPPPDTIFILTSSEPQNLLPTMLSRLVRLHVARLPDSVVTEYVQRELPNVPQAALSQLVADAEGSIGKLLALQSTNATSSQSAQQFLAASRGPEAERFALALAQPPFQARGAFTALLDDLLRRLRAEAVAGANTGAVVTAIARVLEARELAQGNVNPQLLTAVLGADLWGTP